MCTVNQTLSGHVEPPGRAQNKHIAHLQMVWCTWS